MPFEHIHRGYSNWQGFEFECSEIVGLESTTCSVRGPRPDRPVMQVSFEPKPIKKKLFESPHSSYLKRLKRYLVNHMESLNLKYTVVSDTMKNMLLAQ